jgi:hypothetical protein
MSEHLQILAELNRAINAAEKAVGADRPALATILPKVSARIQARQIFTTRPPVIDALDSAARSRADNNGG